MTKSTRPSADVISELQTQINNDPVFAVALKASLELAGSAGQKKLNSDLYKALNTLYAGNGWPATASDYISYLTQFMKVIPSENTDPDYDPWRNTSEQNGYSQEVYDRLCHFYWLVDQSKDGKSLQDYTNPSTGFKFSDWLIDYANAWGSFLDTSGSLTPATLQSFQNDPEYNLPDYSNDASNWKSFNTFFYRQLNSTRSDGTPMRPVANPGDNTIICSPADCTFKQHYQIDQNGNVVGTDGQRKSVRLKQTHSIGNINELLGGAASYASNFSNGTFVHYFLSPFDYHRFHTPVSGTVLYLNAEQGKVYLAVDIASNGQFDAPDAAEDGYEFTQARGVLIIDTGNKNVGKVAIIPIGMAQVSSVHMSTALQGKPVLKGQEFGYFAFGGSDIIMLFEKPTSELKFITSVANAEDASSYQQPLSFHFKYGEPSVVILDAS